MAATSASKQIWTEMVSTDRSCELRIRYRRKRPPSRAPQGSNARSALVKYAASLTHLVIALQSGKARSALQVDHLDELSAEVRVHR